MNRNVLPFLNLSELKCVRAGCAQDLPLATWDALFGTKEQADAFVKARGRRP